MPSNHLIFCHPLNLLPSVFPSTSFFSIESVLRIRWPKYWSFSFSISPSNEYSGLISFRMDWLDLLATQGTLKSLLQHHSSKASILQCSGICCITSSLINYKNFRKKPHVCYVLYLHWDFPGASVVRKSTCQAGDMGLIPEWGRSPGEVNGNLLQ